MHWAIGHNEIAREPRRLAQRDRTPESTQVSKGRDLTPIRSPSVDRCPYGHGPGTLGHFTYKEEEEDKGEEEDKEEGEEEEYYKGDKEEYNKGKEEEYNKREEKIIIKRLRKEGRGYRGKRRSIGS